MNASSDNTAAEGLRAWWASPPRSGMRRMLAPWEYRHLRAWAGVRIGAGIALVDLAAVTLSFGGDNWKAHGWTMVFLALAAGQFSLACRELAIDRAATARA